MYIYIYIYQNAPTRRKHSVDTVGACVVKRAQDSLHVQ